jgi:hypothetical protein
MADCVGIPQQFDKPKAFQTIRDANRLKGFVASIVLHSNQIWRDLREFYSLVGFISGVIVFLLQHGVQKNILNLGD